jgi:hypothetical protein
MSLGSRVRRNFTLDLLCLFWVNVRTANQLTRAPPEKRPDIGANGGALPYHPRHTNEDGPGRGHLCAIMAFQRLAVRPPPSAAVQRDRASSAHFPKCAFPCEAEGALRVSFQSGMDSGFRPRGRPRNHKDLCALSGLQARIPDDRDLLISGRGLLDMGDRGERVVEALHHHLFGGHRAKGPTKPFRFLPRDSSTERH